MPTITHYDKNDKRTVLASKHESQVWNVVVNHDMVCVLTHDRNSDGVTHMRLTNAELKLILQNIMERDYEFLDKFKQDIKELVNQY